MFEITVMICMKKLSYVTVLDHKVKIKYSDDKENWGECDSDKMVITLSTDCLKDAKLHYWTLVHEVTHMILRLSGVAFMEANDEEAYVRCIENLVIPWVLKNQNIIAQK
jgi:hypothetical protein